LEDAEELARLHIETWQSAYRGLVPDERLDTLSHEEFTGRWRGNIEKVGNGRENRIAVEAGRIAGFVSFGPSPDEGVDPTTTASIYGLYVHPSAWRSGVGRTLAGEAVARLTARGFQMVTLWTWERNERARRFYERVGFAYDGTSVLSDRFRVPLVEVRYCRELGDDAESGEM
jgi:ribosomal protein S18 acetylase RimI-like enzyme